MNLTVVTFIAFVVAVLIVMWAVTEMTSRYMRQKQAHTKALTTWVTIKPITPPEAALSKNEGAISEGTTEGITDAELNKHAARHNGHYSHHKSSLQ